VIFEEEDDNGREMVYQIKNEFSIYKATEQRSNFGEARLRLVRTLYARHALPIGLAYSQYVC